MWVLDVLAHLRLILLQTFLLHHVDELPVADGSVPVEVRLHDELKYFILRWVLSH